VEFQRWLAKNQHTQRKPLYFVNTGNASLSKIGMFLENKVFQKLKLEKKVFCKRWSPKKIHRFLTYKINFESTILAFFDIP